MPKSRLGKPESELSLSSPDINFYSPALEQNTTWQTVHTLPSDHLPILITTHTCLTSTPHQITSANYKRANWLSFIMATIVLCCQFAR